jgi:hypothetical protein
MRRELYINGRLADIDGVSIPLNFACSEIADLSGVSGNYSLTVKLPLTGNNILIAYFANLPNVTPAALWPGYKTTGSYFIDGVPIFQNADVKLLSTEKSIDVQITFGNLAWLDVLANIKLKDIVSEFIDPYVFDWNYWILDNETSAVRWVMADYGGTFESGIHAEHLHPSVNVLALWDAIWLKLVNLGVAVSAPLFSPESDLWLPIMSQVLNQLLRVGSEFNLTVETPATDQTSEQLNFDLLDICSPFNYNPGITFNKAGQQLFIIPKTGKYRIRPDVDLKLSAGNTVANSAGIWMRMQKYGDLSYYPDLILDETFLNTTGDVIVNAQSDVEVDFTKGDLIYIDCTIFQSGGPGYLLNVTIDSGYPVVQIDYVPVDNKKDQLEFFMPYDIALNMPDISCKDFVKAIMQLYGLLVENKNTAGNIENSPVMFNLDSLTGTTFENWSDKLVSFDRPKIEWNLGFKQRNYLRYATDETDNIFEDAYFTTYETDNAEKDLFKSIFAATDDVSLIGTSYFPFPVCSIPLWVVDGETWKYEGKAKQRIFRAYQTGTTFEREVVQLFGEFYSDIIVDETMLYLSYFKDIPDELTDTGQGLDMASIMAKYYTGFIEAVKSNRLFTFQFLLNQIDINKFTHITPVWIEKFSNFFFAKKVLNWEAGRVCNVEMLQLRDSGALGVVPEPVPTEGLELTFDDIANVPVADASSVSDWNTWFSLPTYGTPFTSVEITGNTVKLIGGSNIDLRIDVLYNYNLKEVIDTNCVISIPTGLFYACYGLNKATFPLVEDFNHTFELCTALTEVNILNAKTLNRTFAGCLLNVFNGPLVTHINETNCFLDNPLNTIYLPSLIAIGAPTTDNENFLGVTGRTITLTIPSTLMTCNFGNPDPDIQYLQANNTVTIVTV